MQNPLKTLEGRIQTFIESNSDKLFGSSQDLSGLITKINDTLLSKAKFSSDGVYIAPRSIRVLISTKDATSMSENADLLDLLERSISERAKQLDLLISEPIAISLEADESIASGEFSVELDYENEDTEKTQAMMRAEENIENPVPEGAFFIVNGANIYSLQKALINIGRSRENHLIVDNPKVSRRHGQLRLISGAFHYFDLDSSGGSELNGAGTKGTALVPGDVLSLAGVPLIYGQDSASDLFETQQIESSDRKDLSGPTDPQNPAKQIR
jgi:hypothetical protein